MVLMMLMPILLPVMPAAMSPMVMLLHRATTRTAQPKKPLTTGSNSSPVGMSGRVGPVGTREARLLHGRASHSPTVGRCQV